MKLLFSWLGKVAPGLVRIVVMFNKEDWNNQNLWGFLLIIIVP
jgi:hypothetical protein